MSDQQQQKKDARHRKFLVGFSALTTFLYVGASLGWGPMQLILEQNDHYQDKCETFGTEENGNDDEEDEICAAQSQALLNIPLVATLTQMTMPLLGIVADRCGAPTTAGLMGICFVLGLLLLTLAEEYHMDSLLHPAFVLVAMGAWNGFLLTVLTGLYFVGHTRSRIIFMLNSILDAGGITYLLLYEIQELFVKHQHGAHLIMAGYLVLAVVLMTGQYYFFRISEPEEEEEKQEASENCSSSSSNVDGESPSENLVDLNKNDSNKDLTQEIVDNPNPSPEIPSLQDENYFEGDDDLNPYDDGGGDLPPEPVLKDSGVEYVLVEERPALQQLLSKPYLCLFVFFSIHDATSSFMGSSTRDFLAYLGDDEHDNQYLLIFTFLSPASLLALPAVDWILLRFGFVGGFVVINAMALAYLLIRLCSEDLDVQIVGFIIFSFYRCFMFGLALSFLPTFMSHNLVGKATGLLNLGTGILSFINIPLNTLAQTKLDRNFFVPNLVHTLMLIPCGLAVVGIRQSIVQEERAKERRDRAPSSIPSNVKHPSLYRFSFVEHIPRKSLISTEPLLQLRRRATWHHHHNPPQTRLQEGSKRGLGGKNRKSAAF